VLKGYVLTQCRLYDKITNFHFISPPWLDWRGEFFYTKNTDIKWRYYIVFSVGDKIVYPMHGAGTIQGIEEKKILGEKKQYYIFKLPCNDMDIMIPVESGESVGVREIVDKKVIEDVVVLLRGESTKMNSNWSRRHRENMDKLRTGDIMQVAEVVRNLMRMDKYRSLSSGERKMLINARQVLISEIILAADMDPAEAEKLVDESV